MVNIKLIKMTNNSNNVILDNPTMSYFVNFHKIRRNLLFRYLKEYQIINERHFPYNGSMDWFIVRNEVRRSFTYQLSLTPIGQVEILKFVDWLKDNEGINIYK